MYSGDRTLLKDRKPRRNVATLGLLAAIVAVFGFGAYQLAGKSPSPDPQPIERVPIAAVVPSQGSANDTPPAPEPPLSSALSDAEEPAPAATILSINGRVFDRTTDQSLSGVMVEVLSRPRVEGDPVPAGRTSVTTAGPSARVTTDERGYYSVAGLPVGPYTVLLGEIPGYPMTKAGKSTRHVHFYGDPTAPVRVDFGLARSGTLTGRITINGIPIANMNVLLESQPSLEVTEFTSDEHGDYHVDGIGDYSGSLRARGQVSGTLRATPFVTAVIKSGLTTHADFDFLQGSASLEGDLLLHTRDGNIVAVKGRVVITYAYIDGDDYNLENMELYSDESGHFLAEGLWADRVMVSVNPSIPGIHRHRYTLNLSNMERARQDFHFYETRIDVHIARMPKDKGLDVWLTAIPGHVGKIEGTRAEQRDFLEAHQRCAGGVQSDADGGGSGSLGGLPPGEYTIMASGVVGSYSLDWHAAGDEYYSRRRTTRTYATLPEGTDRISVELSFPEEP